MTKYTTLTIPFSTAGRDDMKAIREFYQLRKEVFIDQMGWDLYSVSGSELDQYDCEWSVYVLIKDNETDEVVAGARMVRTDREGYISQLDEHPTSYMLRDAHLGRLEGLPDKLCNFEPPRDPNIWELTRLTAKGRAGREAMIAVNDFLNDRGASQCLALGSPMIFRVAKKLGFRPEPIGDVQEDGKEKFFAFRCWVYNADIRAERAVS